MPRQGTISADVKSFLEDRPDGATIATIAEALKTVRRSPVLRHSVRSAIYQHLDDQGQMLFKRMERGRYGLQRL